MPESIGLRCTSCAVACFRCVFTIWSCPRQQHAKTAILAHAQHLFALPIFDGWSPSLLLSPSFTMSALSFSPHIYLAPPEPHLSAHFIPPPKTPPPPVLHGLHLRSFAFGALGGRSFTSQKPLGPAQLSTNIFLRGSKCSHYVPQSPTNHASKTDSNNANCRTRLNDDRGQAQRRHKGERRGAVYIAKPSATRPRVSFRVVKHSFVLLAREKLSQTFETLFPISPPLIVRETDEAWRARDQEPPGLF